MKKKFGKLVLAFLVGGMLLSHDFKVFAEEKISTVHVPGVT